MALLTKERMEEALSRETSHGGKVVKILSFAFTYFMHTHNNYYY